MKNLTTLLLAIFSTLTFLGQTPEKMSYQAVIRDINNNLVSNQSVGIHISILQYTEDGNSVYTETHTPNTNDNGLLSIEIGDGTGVTGVFADINWNEGPYFVLSESDPAGGINYTITGLSQLLSVPFALHAKTAGNTFSGDYNDLENLPTIPVSNSDISNDEGYLSSEMDGDIHNEIQNLSIINDSLDISMANRIELPYNGPWLMTDSTIAYHQGKIGIGTDFPFAKMEILINTEDENRIGFSANAFSPLDSEHWVIGSLGRAMGTGNGGHFGLYGSAGTEVDNNQGWGVRYGVYGGSTDTANAIAYNNGVYGYASGNDNSNTGIDGTAASLVGDNFGVAGYTFTATLGINKSIYGFANKQGAENYAVFGEVTDDGMSTINYSGYFKGAPVAVEDDNIYIKDFNKGVVLTSPDNTCWKVTVDNTGSLTTTSIPCPQ